MFLNPRGLLGSHSAVWLIQAYLLLELDPLSIHHFRHCGHTALTGFSNPFSESIPEQEVRTSSNNSLNDRHNSLEWQRTSPLLEAITIWWAGCEGKWLFCAISLWQTPMHVMWVGARWQGHLFLLLSMWGGTRLWMTTAEGGSVPLAACLCSLPPHDSLSSVLTGPAAGRASLLSQTPWSKDSTLLSVCVHM